MTHAVTRRLAEGRSLEEVSVLTARIKAEARRRRAAREYRTPIDLACAFDRTLVRTPALDLVNDAIAETVATPGGRLVISIPPQEFKTTTLRWTCAHTLLRNPDFRLVFASYAADLARASGRITRGLVTTHSAAWGISVSRDHADASDWQLAGYGGGMFTAGVGGSLTGRPADGMIVDDPIKGRAEADSEAMMRGLHDWWQAVARTRLAPNAWVIVVQTRWVEDDLAGRRMAEGWPSINIPALADGDAPDALERPVGEYLVSTRGRTPADWRDIRRDVGEREWAAMYQGQPAPAAGGIFLREWFARDRVPERPPGFPPVVVVDPADNTGSGDEAGIIVGSMDSSRHIYVGPDYSGHYTTARWVRIALLAVVRHGAARLAYEKSLSGLDRSVRDGWASLYKQARVLRRLWTGEGWPMPPNVDAVMAAVEELIHPSDPEATRATAVSELLELWPLAGEVLGYPDTGPIIDPIAAKGSKQLRAQLVAPVYENRRVHHIGELARLEHQMETWQPDQDSPDRMDAAVHLVTLLSGTSPATLARPRGTVPTRSTQLRRRGGAITRSTGRP